MEQNYWLEERNGMQQSSPGHALWQCMPNSVFDKLHTKNFLLEKTSLKQHIATSIICYHYLGLLVPPREQHTTPYAWQALHLALI